MLEPGMRAHLTQNAPSQMTNPDLTRDSTSQAAKHGVQAEAV